MKRTAALKAILARREAVLFPGAANALFARVIEDTGFEAMYVTGAGIANMYLGVPDIGLTTLSEIAVPCRRDRGCGQSSRCWSMPTRASATRST